MKKLILGATMAVAMATTAAPALAFGDYHKPSTKGYEHHVKPHKNYRPYKPYKPHKPHKPNKPVHEVPEIDAAGAGLALAFVGGILALRRERRKVA